MRRFFGFVLRLVVGLVLFALLVGAAVYALSTEKLHRHYTAQVAALAVPPSPSLIAQGRHLATIRGCSDCHGADLGGAVVIDDSAMGRIWGPNLTSGQGGVAPHLTDADWVRAIRHGIASDGHALVIMPSKDFAGLSDDDVAALLAYAKSVPPVDRTTPPVALGPVARVLLVLGKFQLSADLIDQSHDASIPAVAVAVTPAYGKYLATTCTACHNPHFSGGKIAVGPPDWPPAANLTSGPGGVVSGWTEADFIRTLRTMHAPDGRALNPVMPAIFGQMSDVELKALWAYLQTLPPASTGA